MYPDTLTLKVGLVFVFVALASDGFAIVLLHRIFRIIESMVCVIGS